MHILLNHQASSSASGLEFIEGISYSLLLNPQQTVGSLNVLGRPPLQFNITNRPRTSTYPKNLLFASLLEVQADSSSFHLQRQHLYHPWCPPLKMLSSKQIEPAQQILIQPSVSPAPAGEIQEITLPVAVLEKSPALVQCNTCGLKVVTTAMPKVGTQTHIFAALICLLANPLCVWVPYVAKGLQNIEHRCPVCGVLLATYHRSGRTEVPIQRVTVAQDARE